MQSFSRDQIISLSILLIFALISFFLLVLLTEKDKLIFFGRAEQDLKVFRHEFDPPYFYFFSNAQGKKFVCFQRENREADRVDFSVPWDAWLIDQQEGCTDTWSFAFDPTRTDSLLPQDKVGLRFLCRTPQYDQIACRARINSVSSTPSDDAVEPVDQTTSPIVDEGQPSDPASEAVQPTPVAQGCFFLTAEVYADCDQSDKACRFATHIKFNSTGGDGDIRLERDGVHTAGWNSWNRSEKSAFNYEPRWTGGDIIVRPGESAIHTWTGYATNCGPEGMGIRKVTCTFRNYQGQPIVQGENCFAKNFRNYIIDEGVQEQRDEVSPQDDFSQPDVSDSQAESDDIREDRADPNQNEGEVNRPSEQEEAVSVQEREESDRPDVQGCITPEGRRISAGFRICGLENLSIYKCADGRLVEDEVCVDLSRPETSVYRCISGSGGNAVCKEQQNICSPFFCQAPDQAVKLYTRLDSDNFSVFPGFNDCQKKQAGIVYNNKRTLARFCASQERSIKFLVDRNLSVSFNRSILTEDNSFFQMLLEGEEAFYDAKINLVILAEGEKKDFTVLDVPVNQVSLDLSEAGEDLRLGISIREEGFLNVARFTEDSGFIKKLTFSLVIYNEDVAVAVIMLGEVDFPQGKNPFIELR